MIVWIIILWAVLAKLLEKRKNFYIQKHTAKNINDVDYKIYLKWCLKNGEIPMNKKSILSDVESKEKYLKSL